MKVMNVFGSAKILTNAQTFWDCFGYPVPCLANSLLITTSMHLKAVLIGLGTLDVPLSYFWNQSFMGKR